MTKLKYSLQKVNRGLVFEILEQDKIFHLNSFIASNGLKIKSEGYPPKQLVIKELSEGLFEI